MNKRERRKATAQSEQLLSALCSLFSARCHWTSWAEDKGESADQTTQLLLAGHAALYLGRLGERV